MYMFFHRSGFNISAESWIGAEVHKSCRDWKMLQNEYALSKIRDENLLKYWGLNGVKTCTSCRSRQEFSNEHLLANILGVRYHHRASFNGQCLGSLKVWHWTYMFDADAILSIENTMNTHVWCSMSEILQTFSELFWRFLLRCDTFQFIFVLHHTSV